MMTSKPLRHVPARAGPKMPARPCLFVAASAAMPKARPEIIINIWTTPTMIIESRIPRTCGCTMMAMANETNGAKRLNRAACFGNRLSAGGGGDGSGGGDDGDDETSALLRDQRVRSAPQLGHVRAVAR